MRRFDQSSRIGYGLPMPTPTDPKDSTPKASAEVWPQDHDSGLVERIWERTGRRSGVLTERPLEGAHVNAAWIDRQGQKQQAAGTVIRDAAGKLVVESWADQVRQETAVPRDSMVVAKG